MSTQYSTEGDVRSLGNLISMKIYTKSTDGFSGTDSEQLRDVVLKGKKVKSLQPALDGSGMRVVEW